MSRQNDIGSFSFNLPWFIYDIFNQQLITSVTVPGDMTDVKDVILTEVPIPGLNYAPIQSSGNGNRKVSFTLPLIKRNNTIGNSLLIQQFKLLRNQATGLLNIYAQQFNPNPKVLYYWGTGSVPLIWYVKKCDLTNKKQWTNQLGQPQFSEVSLELWLDENDPLYKAEEMYRKVSAVTSQAIQAFDFISGGRRV